MKILHYPHRWKIAPDLKSLRPDLCLNWPHSRAVPFRYQPQAIGISSRPPHVGRQQIELLFRLRAEPADGQIATQDHDGELGRAFKVDQVDPPPRISDPKKNLRTATPGYPSRTQRQTRSR